VPDYLGAHLPSCSSLVVYGWDDADPAMTDEDTILAR
jgi:hypothetical protein